MGTGLERGRAIQVQLASRGDGRGSRLGKSARSKAKSVSQPASQPANQPVISIVLKPQGFGAVL
jgi:hypothetical protein